MKYVKILGVMSVVAAAVLAFSGTASATVLCKATPTEGTPPTKGTVCPANSAYPAKTTLHIAKDKGTENSKIHTSFKTIECEEVTYVVTTTREGSATETVTGNATESEFSKCNCEVKVLLPASVEVHWIVDTFDGTITASGEELTTSCSTIFGNVHCVYVTSNSHIGRLTGSSTHEKPATIDVGTELPKLNTSALCAEEAFWEVKLEVTSPKPLWVAAHT